MGLEPDHEKAVRSFASGRDVLESLTTGSGKVEASKIASESVTDRG